MALEPNIAQAWLYARLSSSADVTAEVAARISDWPAPQGQAGPYVVYQLQAAFDNSIVGGVRVYTDLEYLVWGGMQTRSYSGALGRLAAAIDAALDGQTGVALSGDILGCERIRPRQQVDPDDPTWRFYGGLYRLAVQA